MRRARWIEPAASLGASGLAIVPWTKGYATSLLLPADGRILVGGADNGRAAVAVLLANGDADPSFDVHAAANKDSTFVTALALDAFGRLLVAGSATFPPLLQRWLATGARDPSFNASVNAVLQRHRDHGVDERCGRRERPHPDGGRRGPFDSGLLLLARYLP